jgi:GDP-4-dehydro-6-deoxy-D-mannose reductase
MHIVITRAFNHTAPGRGEEFAESAFAKQIAEIEKGRRDVLRHGNLESIRNYTDARDIVRGYTMAIDLEPGVYNLCSNNNVSMEQVLDTLIRLAKVPIKTEVDQSLYRPGDFSFKEPTCEKFSELTGWKPVIKFDQTLEDILNYWREQLQ